MPGKTASLPGGGVVLAVRPTPAPHATARPSTAKGSSLSTSSTSSSKSSTSQLQAAAQQEQKVRGVANAAIPSSQASDFASSPRQPRSAEKTPTGKTHEIIVTESSGFSSARLEVRAGDRVVWRIIQASELKEPHVLRWSKATSPDEGGRLTLGPDPRVVASKTFHHPGVYDYHCETLVWMKGVIVVIPSSLAGAAIAPTIQATSPTPETDASPSQESYAEYAKKRVHDKDHAARKARATSTDSNKLNANPAAGTPRSDAASPVSPAGKRPDSQKSIPVSTTPTLSKKSAKAIPVTHTAATTSPAAASKASTEELSSKKTAKLEAAAKPVFSFGSFGDDDDDEQPVGTIPLAKSQPDKALSGFNHQAAFVFLAERWRRDATDRTIVKL